MRRMLIGIAVGLVLGSTAQGAERLEKFTEDRMQTVNDAAFVIPKQYGRLVNVVVNSEIQHLYFEGDDGTIRIVMIGQRGAVVRTRTPIQLLSPSVYVIRRGGDDPS